MDRVEIVKSKHIDFGMYGSDRRFMFTGADGRTYIEKIDFDNGELKGCIEKEDGKLYFCFVSVPDLASVRQGEII